jgi:hypothetical protein
MDGLTALGALGSATPALNLETFASHSPAAAHAPASAPKAATAAEHQDTATFGLPAAQAAAIEAAPSPSPSAELAESASLPLSVKYAPSSIPSNVRQRVHFDRTA